MFWLSPFPQFFSSSLPAFDVLHWGDVFLLAGWRIQEHVHTGRFRLIDPNNNEAASGALRDCHAALDAIRVENDGLGFGQRHIVLLIHGLGGWPGMFDTMKQRLNRDGFEAYAIRYPSTQGSIARHAKILRALLSGLQDVDRVSFVTQSMGGLVLRKALGEHWESEAPPGIGRIVLIAPPSNGCAMADMAAFLPHSQWFGGPAVREITTAAAKYIPPLQAPFGIIAGGTGSSWGLNPFLQGDDDGLVSVDETDVKTAEDFITVRAVHGFIVSHLSAIEATAAYLKTGKFRAA